MNRVGDKEKIMPSKTILLTPAQAERCAFALGCIYTSVQSFKVLDDMGMPPGSTSFSIKAWLFPDQDYVEALPLDPDYWESLLWRKLKGMCSSLVTMSYWPTGLYESDILDERIIARTEIQAENGIVVNDVIPCIALCKAIERMNPDEKTK